MRNAMPSGAGSKVSGIYTPLMLVIWSPEEIHSGPRLTEWIFPCPILKSGPSWRAWRNIPEDQRIESGISSAAAMEIISNVSENRQVTVPAELLASLIQTAEQVLWKREWPPVITASPSRNALPAVRRWLIRPASC